MIRKAPNVPKKQAATHKSINSPPTRLESTIFSNQQNCKRNTLRATQGGINPRGSVQRPSKLRNYAIPEPDSCQCNGYPWFSFCLGRPQFACKVDGTTRILLAPRGLHSGLAFEVAYDSDKLAARVVPKRKIDGGGAGGNVTSSCVVWIMASGTCKRGRPGLHCTFRAQQRLLGIVLVDSPLVSDQLHGVRQSPHSIALRRRHEATIHAAESHAQRPSLFFLPRPFMTDLLCHIK